MTTKESQKLRKLYAYIEQHTLRLEASRRGGGIEIDASEYLKLPNAKMTAYQNYLGGGLLGAVQSDRNFSQCNTPRETKYQALADALRRYFQHITNEDATDWDEWNDQSYEQNQSMPKSAY